MHRWQSVVSDLEPPCLAYPSQTAFHHVADLSQAAAMSRPRPRQVVLDTPDFQGLPVLFAAIGAISVQRLRLAAWPPAWPLDRRDVIEQGQCLAPVGTVRSGDADGQRGAVAIDDDVAFAAFFG